MLELGLGGDEVLADLMAPVIATRELLFEEDGCEGEFVDIRTAFAFGCVVDGGVNGGCADEFGGGDVGEGRRGVEVAGGEVGIVVGVAFPDLGYGGLGARLGSGVVGI